ncbi:MAG: hypothetical protein UT05_C0003G0099 [Parcubacteria group bacterium GW2011_GWF2_38_76]|nr:MAG: hypothetical protein UT05_C0003G0099 [Parcubacteria group bacterium GW2011_GWF2_38_76]
MKKISLVVVLSLFLFSLSLSVRAESSTEDLSLLQKILEQAKTLQQKLVEREIALSVYKMKVVSPNGGETIKAGQYVDLKWDTTESGVSKINVYLTTSADDGNKKEPGYLIAKDLPVTAPFYHWLVPNNLAGQGYKLFIRNNGKNYRLGDYSDSTFTISPPEAGVSSVKLNSPKGGEMYIAGRTYSIHWNMPKGSDRYVSIRLIDGDSDANSTDYIDSGLEEYIPASQGSTEWVIPESVPSGDYKIKIIGLSNLSCGVLESSNVFVSGVFKVVQNTDLPNKIVLLSPPPVSEILSGTPQTISWISPYDSDRVDIFLRGLPSGRNYLIKYGVDSGRPIDDNKFVWTPKSPYDKDEKFTILVCRSSAGNCAESQSPFSIVSEKQPEEMTPSPIIDIDNPDYDRLKDIVDSIDAIVSRETATYSPIVPEAIPSVSVTDYASPKQSGYLPYNFDRRMSVGLVDDDGVRALQEALTREGLFNHPITGRFFGITEAAVKAFQIKYGFDPSGSTGPGTQRKLNELYSTITVASPENISLPIIPEISPLPTVTPVSPSVVYPILPTIPDTFSEFPVEGLPD